MADTGAVDPTAEAIAKSKQHWTEESLERRRAFLVKAYWDPEDLMQMTGEALVHYCLVVEGLVAGKRPLKQTKVVDPMVLMMEMWDKMESSRQAREE